MTTTVETIPRRETIAEPVASDAEITAADYYQAIFVPALFAEWSPRAVDAAGVAAGDRVLDVACGTGTAAQAAAERAGASAVVGLDIAPGMLAVARRLYPSLQWRCGSADALPFDGCSFDRVLCQFGLMFFPDRVAALREMLRVLRPGGRLVLVVWDSLERNPGFADKVAILEDTTGRRAADALRAPFVLGERGRLEDLAREAGLRAIEVCSCRGEARFDSVDAFVDAELRGWLPVMDVHLDEAVMGRVRERCRRRMRRYGATESGGFTMPTSAHILCAGC